MYNKTFPLEPNVYMVNTMDTSKPAYGQKHVRSRVFFIFCLLISGLLSLSVSTSVASAATYYCDPVSGNTTQGDGSTESPWGTLESILTYPNVKIGIGKTVVGGDTVKLRTGYHGFPSKNGVHNDGYVTIEPEEGESPTLKGINLPGGQGFIFSGLTISPELAPVYAQVGYLISVVDHPSDGNAFNIIVEDCNIYSVADTTGWDANAWNANACSGINVEGPNNIIRNNTIKNIGMGILAGGDNVLVENNTITNFSADGLRVNDGDNQVWQYNTVKNCYDVGANHDDGLQVYTGGTVVNNLTIRGNYILEYEDPEQPLKGPLQGILCAQGPDTNFGWIVENNVVIVTSHGISIKDAANSKIANNTVMRPPNSPYDDYYPEITLYADGNAVQYGSDTVIRNNIAGRFPEPNETDGVVVDYNLDIDDYDPNVLFVDYQNFNVHLREGSPAIDAGSSTLAPDIDADKNTRPQGTGFDIGAYEYIPSDSNNQAPVLENIGSKSVNEDALLTFTVTATDADSDTITYLASGTAIDAGAALSGQTFSWTPGYDQADSYQVTFIASDGQAQDSETITITVNNVNRAPVLDAIGDKSTNENSALSFSVSASDADSDTITYSASGTAIDAGAALSGQTFSWTPGYDQADSYQVTFIASDSQAQDSETITITVNNVNRAPVLESIGSKSIDENNTLSFSVSASDADNDTITYSVESLPSGAAFVSQSFTWTPGYEQAGTHQVTFVASDSQAQDSETITVTVNNVNRAPILSTIGNQSVYTDDSLTFTVSATDPDGDTITYSVEGSPSGATFANQTFSWTPGDSQVGSYEVTFAASDDNAQDSESITITVSADTSAPSVTNCSPAAGDIQVPLNNLIILHIVDTGKGVDANSVAIKVNNNTVYTGNTADYSSEYGHCRRVGTNADYTFIYQANDMFDFDQTVTVTVNATDIAGNAMSEYSYSFKTEMRSFGQNKRVNSDSDNSSKNNPATVRDTSGNIWAAWHAGQTGSRDIYVGKLTAGEDSFDNSVQLTSNAADQCNAAIAIDTDDKLYVVWQDNRQGNWDIYISTSADGTNWSTERPVIDANDNQINPAIVIDGSSSKNAYIVWQDDQAGNQDIYVASSSNDFATKTTSQITSDTSDQTEPAIAVDPDNTIYLVWTDARGGSNDIYGAASNNGPWTNVAIVNNANNQSNPAIAAEAVGSILHLLWVDDTSGDRDIYYAYSNGLPSSPLTGSTIIDDTASADQLEPVIAVTGSTGNNLKVFACWQDERNADTDLYVAEVGSGSETNVLVDDDGTNANQSKPAIGVDINGYPYLVWADSRNTNADIYYVKSTFVESSALASTDVSISADTTVGTELGAISSVDDVSVIVPAGAYACDIKITISRVKNPPAFTLESFSLPYEFGPSGINFDQPVTVTIPYEVSASGNSASAYWYNPLTGTLSQYGITDIENFEISSSLHALRFKTTHLTQFIVGGTIGDILGGGGGGGGGGGCAISPNSQGNIVEFLLPYAGYIVVMIVIKCRDTRKRKARNMVSNKC